MADLLGSRSPLPSSLSQSLAGSPLPPPLEWNLSESGQEGPKLYPQSRTSETGAVNGSGWEDRGTDCSRLVPRLLGLSVPLCPLLPHALYSSSFQSAHEDEAFWQEARIWPFPICSLILHPGESTVSSGRRNMVWTQGWPSKVWEHG